MTIERNSVVPKPKHLTEAEFHAALMVDWSRMIRRWGIGEFANRARMSERQVRNILAGSTPHALTIFNLQVDDDHAIDCVESEFGRRTVPKDAICSSDPGTLPLATLLHKVAEAEHPESHGGTDVTDYEAQHIPEEDLLAVQRFVSRLIEMKRKPVLKAVR